MKISHILILLFSLALFNASGQNCAGIKEKNERIDDKIIITKSIKIEKRADISKLKENLRNQLQLDMARLISTAVKEKSTLSVHDNNGEFEEFFNSQLEIGTNSTLGFATLEYCEDKENKTLWGTYTINAKELAKTTIRNCNSQMIALNSEIHGLSYSNNKIDLSLIHNKFDKIVSEHNNAVFLDNQVNIENWDNLVANFEEQFGRLSNSQDQVIFNQKFNTAKDLIKLGKYFDGIQVLKNLKVDYSKNEQLLTTLENAQIDYRKSVLLLTSSYDTQGDFQKMLDMISKYCSICTCDAEIEQRKNAINKAFFNDQAIKFREAIKYREIEKVNLHKKQIDALRSVDPDEYLEISEEFDSFHRTIGMEKAIAEKDKKNYWASYHEIEQLENVYGKRDNELTNLKAAVRHEILKEEYAKTKMNRQHTLSLWLGSDITFSDIRIDSSAYYQSSDYIHTYSTGIYLKYRYEKEFKKRTYPVRSDYVGFRMRVFDYSSYHHIYDSIASNLSRSLNQKFSFEFALDGITWRVIHYGFGIGFPQTKTHLEPSYYIGTIGFRLPLGRISWINDFNFKTNFNGIGYLNYSTGIAIRFDFNHKFNRADKKKIQAELFH